LGRMKREGGGGIIGVGDEGTVGGGLSRTTVSSSSESASSSPSRVSRNEDGEWVKVGLSFHGGVVVGAAVVCWSVRDDDVAGVPAAVRVVPQAVRASEVLAGAVG